MTSILSRVNLVSQQEFFSETENSAKWRNIVLTPTNKVPTSFSLFIDILGRFANLFGQFATVDVCFANETYF